MGHKVTLTKRVGISAMHELKSPLLNDEENKRIFGKCFNTHGHDYYLEVTVTGTPDKTSGLICNRDQFEDILQTEIVERFNKTHLNHFFSNTSGEALVVEFYNLLKSKLKAFGLIRVRLQETPRNFFTYPNC